MISKEEKELYDSYANWMKSKGSIFSKISLKYFYEDYRGIIADEDIDDEETILFIPVDAMITLEMAKVGPIGKKLIANNANLVYPNNSTLATYVLWEMANPNTPWTYLFKALPQSVSIFPIFYTPEELKLLTGSFFIKFIEELKDDMKYDYDTICRWAPEFSKIASLQDFMKIRTLVNSRIFGIEINGKECDAIVPYADMFNFEFKNEMTVWSYDNENKGFIIKANKPIMKGQEISVYYGDKQNYNYLQFYGFALENNEYDEVIFEIAPNETDPLIKYKEELLDYVKLPKRVKVKATTANNKFAKAISFIRFMVFDGNKEDLAEVLY